MNVEVKNSEIHGRGVFAKEPFVPGDYQIIYGEMVPDTPGSPVEDYIFDGGWLPWAPWYFMNHSEDPNCYVEVDDNDVTYVVVDREIEVGEELTLDYGYQPWAM